MNNFHELEWVDGKTLQAYSSFGKLGGGFGGLQVSGKVGKHCQKLTSYCGKWVHQLKAAGMPPSFAPAQCSQQWVANQHQKLMSSAQYLGGLSEFDVAGHRMEIRIGPCNEPCSNWGDQLQEVKDIFEGVSKLLFAKALSFSEVLEAIKVALGEAEQSGLFRYQQDHRNSRAPGHKLVDYNRLAHIFGLVNKFTHRHSFKLCQSDAPWGPDQPSEDMSLAGTWPVNPDLPNTVPRVLIRDGMSAKDVQVIGQVQGATVDNLELW